VTLLDAYALVAFVAGGPAEQEVRALLRDGDAGVATANLIEAIDVAARVHGVSVDRTRSVLEPLFDQTLAVAPLDLDGAWRAAELRAAHYHRTRCPVSLADCVLLATAGAGDRIATADPDLVEVAEREGIGLVRLPDSSGRRP
jgi:predicted nucleic acid-binding protein